MRRLPAILPQAGRCRPPLLDARRSRNRRPSGRRKARGGTSHSDARCYSRRLSATVGSHIDAGPDICERRQTTDGDSGCGRPARPAHRVRPFVKQVTQLSGSGPLPGRLYPKLYPLSGAFGVMWYENSVAKDRKFEPVFTRPTRSVRLDARSAGRSC